MHSRQEYDQAVAASNILFGKSTTEDLGKIDEDTLLSVFEGVPQQSISRNDLTNASDIADLLSVTTNGLIFQSKGEARRMIKGGGVSVNKIRIASPEQQPDFTLLQNKYLLVQKGKKHYFLIKVVA